MAIMMLFALIALSQTAMSTKPAEAKIDLAVPAELEARGEHGTVIVDGDVTSDGYITNPVIARSSRSDAIDAVALLRAAKVRLSQKLLESKPSKFRLVMRFYQTQGFDLGTPYTCSQAVRDADWHRSKFPEEPIERSPLYALIQTSGMILDAKELAFASNPTFLDKAWLATLDACRATPDAGFTQTLIRVGNK